MRTLIYGGPLFDGKRMIRSGALLIQDRHILSVTDGPPSLPDADRCIDTKGDMIMPGLVDLHSDSLERCIEKRKGVLFDVDFALLNLDRQLSGCGITSFCHAISFADNELGLRSPKQAQACVDAIRAFNDSGQALIRHFTHIRYEVGSSQSLDIILDLIDQGAVDMLSIMDHTPGQGQFRSLEAYMKFHTREYALPWGDIVRKAKEKKDNHQHAWEMVKQLANHVAEAKIPMLSHDDDTVDKVQLVKRMGINASEFPVSMIAAKTADSLGLDLFMGAPNLIRNVSTSGNLKASELMAEGLCTGLVSDYYPESLLQAAFMAEQFYRNPCNALASVTSGPGRFLDRPGYPGFLIPGGNADFIVVNQDYKWAHLTRAFVKGKQIYSILPDFPRQHIKPIQETAHVTV